MIRFILLSIFAASKVLCCFPLGFKPDFLYGCSIFVEKLDHGPILVSTDTHQLLYPELFKARVYIPKNQKFIVSCPGSHISASGVNFSTTEEATCHSNGQLKINNETVDFDKIGCSSDPSHIVRSTGHSCAGDAGKEIEIGFSIASDIFIRQILICFDEQSLTPIYATYDINRSTRIREEDAVQKSTFMEDTVGNLKINELYDEDALRQVVNSRVGLPPHSTKHIRDGHGLVRGYLAPKTHFVYAWQQLATLHYANSVPLWNGFVQSEWRDLATVFGRFAEMEETDITMHVGTHGVATLSHEGTGDEVPLYLNEDHNVTRIPVPELFWQTFYYDSDTGLRRSGLVVVGVNAPSQQAASKVNHICNETVDRWKWPRWVVPEIQTSTENVFYWCNDDDFRKQVSYFP